MGPHCIAREHVMIAKHCFRIRKIIEVQISRNILIETKLSTEPVGTIVFHNEVVFTTVSNKTRTNTDKVGEVSP